MQLNNWRQESAVTLQVASWEEREIEGDDSGDKATEEVEVTTDYRLIFHTLSVFDESRFKARRRDIWDRLDEICGPAEKRDDDARERYMLYLDIFVKHAAILSALKSVERLDDKKWVADQLPEEWRDPLFVAEQTPHMLVNKLYEAVLDAGNPHAMFAFGFDDSDETKKNLRVVVNRSAS